MTGRRLKDALLERYLADAVAGEAKEQLEAILRDSPADQARLRELRADSEAFLTQHPPGQMAARFEKEFSRSRWRLPMLLAPLLAGAAAAWVLVASFPPEEEPAFVVKGGVALTLHKRQGASSARVAPGDSLAPGDALRFEVKAPGSGYVAILGKDAAGRVTVYHPYGERSAAPYDARLPLLPTAIELDETRGREDFFALWSAQPFRVEPAIEALERGEPLEGAVPTAEVGAAFILKP